ncbi:hypothetical protein CBR_g45443 [Chara braunii]|uniref:DUF659 domain-containing protein n=1 Tax=Chara braunii TaxID=69332 RepID=A0A388LYK8_CHABU|nr:hypothetical protein CBR_g45443 [Chara braunii]|eukprot:GBG87386.1 hypothetical protein CBR_g45443 [Chara braunii]
MTGETQSRPQERDPVEEVQEFLDETARQAEAGGVEEGGGTGTTPDLSGAEVVMTTRGSSVDDHHDGDARGRAGKRPVESGVEGVPQACNRQRQFRLDEVYDQDAQAGFRDTVLQWVYDSGIPFAAFRRHSWLRHRAVDRHASQSPVSLSIVQGHWDDGIVDQRGKFTRILREVRSLFESVGATVFSNGRQSRDARPIVNFLTAAKRGALIYAIVHRDGSVPEKTQIVLRRWKVILRFFPPKDVLAICTDSASNYTSPAKLLAEDSDLQIRHIAWLPCHPVPGSMGSTGRPVPPFLAQRSPRYRCHIADRRAVDVHRGSGRCRTDRTQSRPHERDLVKEVQEFLDEEARQAEAGGVKEGEGTDTTPDLSGEEVVMTAQGRSVADHHKGHSRGRAGKSRFLAQRSPRCRYHIADRRVVDVHRRSGRGSTSGIQSRSQERDPVEEVQEFLDEEARQAEVRDVEEGGGTSTTPNLSGEELVMTARGSSAADHHEGDARGRAGKRSVESGNEGVRQARKR